MKKFTAILMAALMILALAGCSDAPEEKPAPTEKVNEAAAVIETTTTTAQAPETTAEAEEEEEEPVIFKLDTSLENEALLASIPAMMPQSLYTKTESTAADGTVAITELWTKDDGSWHSETVDPYTGKAVMIYNPIDGNLYVYSETDGTGMISNDGPEEEDGPDADIDTDGATYMDYLADDNTSMTAKVEDLDGIQVIHFHSETSESGYTMVIEHWYTVDYMIAIKSETYMDGNLIATSRVLDYEINPSIDDSMFERPDGIEFVEMPF